MTAVECQVRLTVSEETENREQLTITLTPYSYLTTVMASDLESLKMSISEAEREVDVAERYLRNSQIKLQFLKQQLQNLVISEVSGMKSSQSSKPTAKPKLEEDEAARKARVRRRWRVLFMKIKFGLGAQAMAMKRRNLGDASSFIERETEVKNYIVSLMNISFIRKPQRKISWISRASVCGKQETRDTLEEEVWLLAQCKIAATFREIDPFIYLVQ